MSKIMEIRLDNAYQGVPIDGKTPRFMFPWTGQQGPVINGKLIIRPTEDVTVKGVTLEFKAQISVKWSETRGKNTVHFAAKRPLAERIWVFLPKSDSKLHLLRAGIVYAYDFQLVLPINLPNSVGMATGKVEYKFLANGKRPAFTFDLDRTQALEIYQSLEPNHPHCLFPLQVTADWEQTLHYTIQIPTKAFSHGTPISVTVRMHSLLGTTAHWQVRECSMKVKEYFHFIVPNRSSRVEKRNLIEAKHTSWPQPSTPVETALSFKLPLTNIMSTVNTELLKCSHKLKLVFTIDINGKSRKLNVEFDLYIPGPFGPGIGPPALMAPPPPVPMQMMHYAPAPAPAPYGQHYAPHMQPPPPPTPLMQPPPPPYQTAQPPPLQHMQSVHQFAPVQSAYGQHPLPPVPSPLANPYANPYAQAAFPEPPPVASTPYMAAPTPYMSSPSKPTPPLPHQAPAQTPPVQPANPYQPQYPNPPTPHQQHANAPPPIQPSYPMPSAMPLSNLGPGTPGTPSTPIMTSHAPTTPVDQYHPTLGAPPPPVPAIPDAAVLAAAAAASAAYPQPSQAPPTSGGFARPPSPSMAHTPYPPMSPPSQTYGAGSQTPIANAYPMPMPTPPTSFTTAAPAPSTSYDMGGSANQGSVYPPPSTTASQPPAVASYPMPVPSVAPSVPSPVIKPALPPRTTPPAQTAASAPTPAPPIPTSVPTKPTTPPTPVKISTSTPPVAQSLDQSIKVDYEDMLRRDAVKVEYQEGMSMNQTVNSLGIRGPESIPETQVHSKNPQQRFSSTEINLEAANPSIPTGPRQPQFTGNPDSIETSTVAVLSSVTLPHSVASNAWANNVPPPPNRTSTLPLASPPPAPVTPVQSPPTPVQHQNSSASLAQQFGKLNMSSYTSPPPSTASPVLSQPMSPNTLVATGAVVAANQSQQQQQQQYYAPPPPAASAAPPPSLTSQSQYMPPPPTPPGQHQQQQQQPPPPMPHPLANQRQSFMMPAAQQPVQPKKQQQIWIPFYEVVQGKLYVKYRRGVAAN